MTAEDLRAIADRIVETMAREHPDEASALAAWSCRKILALGLYGGSEDETDGFAMAVNASLRDRPRPWRRPIVAVGQRRSADVISRPAWRRTSIPSAS
jgi:hypothetical protein